ncbi:glutamine synthetase family protein [Streptomyces sp. NPDC019990]|uniref:glutamine synthetase family protein n=1 Tax=Streptomyces sp. NPDC019990 TaxID=3154693 RepID=UPI0033C627D7
MDAQQPPTIQQRVDQLAAEGIDVVRVGYPDLIGVDRGRDVFLSHLPSVVRHGLTFCQAVYHTSPRGDVVDIAGGLAEGLPDVCVHPDLDTLVALPWEPGVVWCLGDPIDPATGQPVPESPRDLLRRVTGALAGSGISPVVGPELEYFLLERDAAAPQGWRRYQGLVGNVYSSGLRGDPERHLLRTLRQLDRLGVGASAGNQEFDEGQFEINLTHSDALDAADRAFRFKAAVRELARAEGRLATFMAKPFNDSGGCGFHLHVSCLDSVGRNIFDAPSGTYGLSASARHAIAGLIGHAPALAALLNPTINSYKRFGRDSLAPWLIDWGLDNRSAMLRIPPERGPGARLELRLGDASANPYLAIAGLLAALHLGLEAKAEPPAPLEGYGYDPSRAARLPQTLDAALDALEADTELTDVLGKPFVDAFLGYKRNELERFERHVTDWEFGEYVQHV